MKRRRFLFKSAASVAGLCLMGCTEANLRRVESNSPPTRRVHADDKGFVIASTGSWGNDVFNRLDELEGTPSLPYRPRTPHTWQPGAISSAALSGEFAQDSEPYVLIILEDGEDPTESQYAEHLIARFLTSTPSQGCCEPRTAIRIIRHICEANMLARADVTGETHWRFADAAIRIFLPCTDHAANSVETAIGALSLVAGESSRGGFVGCGWCDFVRGLFKSSQTFFFAQFDATGYPSAATGTPPVLMTDHTLIDSAKVARALFARFESDMTLRIAEFEHYSESLRSCVPNQATGVLEVQPRKSETRFRMHRVLVGI